VSRGSDEFFLRAAIERNLEACHGGQQLLCFCERDGSPRLRFKVVHKRLQILAGQPILGGDIGLDHLELIDETAA
jgi:hypothetical protein